MKLLIIAYYFPPVSMGGIQRIINFVRYLPKFGIEPIVLTVKEIKYFAKDYSLLKRINCKIIRTESIDPLRLANILKIKIKLPKFKKMSGFITRFFLPDNKIGWLPFAIIDGIKLDFDCIFATAPPYTSLIIGYIIKKIKNKPIIVELRDKWPYYPYFTRIHKIIDEKIQYIIFNSSDEIIATEEEKLPKINKKMHILPHGYNPENFNFTSKENKFTISYVGSFTGERSPKNFLIGLKEAMKEIPKEDIIVNFVGFHTENEEILVKEFGLSDIVKLYPYMPHNECIKFLNSDVLLLLSTEGEIGVFSSGGGKFGEYIGARKPILAIIPNCSIANFIIKNNLGEVVNPYDIKGIKQAIINFYHKYNEGKLSVPYCNEVEKLRYENIVKMFAEIVRNVINRLS